MTELVRNVRNAQAPAHPSAHLEEDTVVAVLNTIHEIVSDSLDNARSLLQARGVPALVALVASRWVRAGPAEGWEVWGWRETRCGRPLTPALAAAAVASQCGRPRQHHTCYRLCGATRSCVEPYRGMAGRKHASRCSCPALSLTLLCLIPSRSVLGLTSSLCFVPP